MTDGSEVCPSVEDVSSCNVGAALVAARYKGNIFSVIWKKYTDVTRNIDVTTVEERCRGCMRRVAVGNHLVEEEVGGDGDGTCDEE